jgi:hypothetical protein
MSDVSQVLLETIDYAVDCKLDDAQFDRTLLCTVTNISGNTVTVSHGKETYTVTLKNPLDLSIFQKVHLRFPGNNAQNKYLEEDINSAGGGASSIGVTSINGMTGSVNIDFSSANAKAQTIMSKDIPETQNSGDVWYKITERVEV